MWGKKWIEDKVENSNLLREEETVFNAIKKKVFLDSSPYLAVKSSDSLASTHTSLLKPCTVFTWSVQCLITLVSSLNTQILDIKFTHSWNSTVNNEHKNLQNRKSDHHLLLNYTSLLTAMNAFCCFSSAIKRGKNKRSYMEK